MTTKARPSRAPKQVLFLRKQAMLLQQRFLGKPIFIHINKCGGTSIEAALGIPKTHDTVLIRRRRVGAAAWDKAFTFSVVRHPYSRVISWYHHVRRHDETGVRTDGIALNDWITRAFGEKDPQYHDQLRWYAPCTYWLSNEDGNISVDYVARLETLEEEWPTIAARIGAKAQLPRRNTSEANSADWSVLSAPSRAILDRTFQSDFEMFGYDPA